MKYCPDSLGTHKRTRPSTNVLRVFLFSFNIINSLDTLRCTRPSTKMLRVFLFSFDVINVIQLVAIVFYKTNR